MDLPHPVRVLIAIVVKVKLFAPMGIHWCDRRRHDHLIIVEGIRVNEAPHSQLLLHGTNS